MLKSKWEERDSLNSMSKTFNRWHGNGERVPLGSTFTAKTGLMQRMYLATKYLYSVKYHFGHII